MYKHACVEMRFCEFTVMQDYSLHRLDSAPPTSTTVTRDEFLHYYREMCIIRAMENNARDMYREKNIRGFLHLCIGQVRETVSTFSHYSVPLSLPLSGPFPSPFPSSLSLFLFSLHLRSSFPFSGSMFCRYRSWYHR